MYSEKSPSPFSLKITSLKYECPKIFTFPQIVWISGQLAEIYGNNLAAMQGMNLVNTNDTEQGSFMNIFMEGKTET